MTDQTQAETNQPAPRPRPRPAPEPEMDLGQSPYGDLPEVYFQQGPDGQQIQVRKPCYRLLTEHFLDSAHFGGTLYQEGEVIITEGVPTFHMQPLNRAAGERIHAWVSQLPFGDKSINIDDALEAVQMLAKNPDFDKMSQELRASTLANFAARLKDKRNMALGMTLPPMAGPTFGTRVSSAPAMTAARFTDPNRRGPGQVGETNVLHQPASGAAQVSRARAPIANARP